MHVLVIGTRGIPNIQGGVETHCEELYPRLVKLGCDIIILTRLSYIQNLNIKKFKNVKLKHIQSPTTSGLETIIHTFKGCIYAIKNRKNIDLIHIHNIGPAIFIPLLKFFSFKIIVTYHSQNYKHEKWGWLAKILFKIGEYFSVKYADKIIFLSENIKNDIKNKYTRFNYNIILNGVNIPKKSNNKSYISSLELHSKKYIIAVGRFIEEKGFHDLIIAYSNMNNDIKFVLVGDADYESKYSIKLKEEAKQNGVILTGFIKGEKLNEIFSHAKLFVMTSYHEGLPIALLEAMSYNLDVLVSDIPANLEVGLDKDDYFKVGNIENLKNRLEEKLSNNIDRNFEKIIQEKYNWDKIAKQTFDVYKFILLEKKCV